MKLNVFKTRDKYETDLHHKAKQLGLNTRRNKKLVWEEAKLATSKVEFVQNINFGQEFVNLKPKEQESIKHDLAHDIAQGKNYSIQ